MTIRRWRILGAALLSAAWLGCETVPEAPPESITTEHALPLKAAFVYEEQVYAVGAKFSLAPPFWSSLFPRAAEAFRESSRAGSYEEALRSDADVIVVARNVVHGARDRFKYSLLVSVRDPSEKLLFQKGYEDQAITPDTVAASFEANGRLLRDRMAGTPEIRNLRRRPASG